VWWVWSFLFFVALFSLLAVFYGASAFNQDVSTWNTGAVTSTYNMFQGATAFADNNFFCAGSTNTGSWPTSVIRASDFVGSGVTDFSCGSNHLNNIIITSVVDDWCGTDAAKKTAVQTAHGPIGHWDVSRITNMENLFYGKHSFDNDLSKWNTGAVTNMVSMFQNAEAFNQDVSDWNTGAVTTMEDSKCTLSLSL
jgi:surface protein